MATVKRTHARKRYAARLAAASLCILAATSLAPMTGPAHAQNRPAAPRTGKTGGGGDVLGHAEQFLSIGTRNSRDSAVIFAREYAGDFPSVSVARLTDGNWAVFVGIVANEDAPALLRTLKQAGRIPNSAAMTPGDKVDDIVWSPNGATDNETLQLSPKAPRTPILNGLGLAGKWAVNPRNCGDTQNDDLLESEFEIEPRAMRWGEFGRCEFGSIVRVGGGVFLDANCRRGDKRESFVLSLKREGAALIAVTDPTEKNRLSYTLQACGRVPVALGPAPSAAPAARPQPPQPPQARNVPPASDKNPAARIERAGVTPSPQRPPASDAKPKSTGSGFFVSDTGFLVTNEHVVNECSSVQVKGFGAARVMKIDAENDLALLKIEPPKPVAFLKVRTEPARLGQDVVVFGFPLSSVLENGLNVTTGIISSEIGLHNDKRMLQFTAAIQPGNSGGPVVDRTGNLVAVVRSKFSDKFALERGSFVPQNLNYGIKTDVLLRFLGDNGVKAEIQNEQKDRTVAELAANAREHTQLVACH